MLRQHLESDGRVYLVGERRIGKTSLIFEAVRTLKGYRVIYVDLMAVKTTADVVQRMASALVKSEKQQSRVLALLKELAHLQPVMSIDPITNVPTIGFSPGAGGQPETLDGVFSLFESDKKSIVVFDEFQDIQQVSGDKTLLARLRGLVQHQESSSYVFCGSIRSSMEDIFSNHESPFFNMAMRLYLGPLDQSEFVRFLNKKFLAGDRTLADGVLAQIIGFCGENPGAVQRFCTALWQATSAGQTIGPDELLEAWKRLFAMQSDQYGMILQGLSAQQAQTLRALARTGGKTKVSREFAAMTGITLSGSVVRAFQGLVTKRVVVKEGAVYRMTDPFLTAWLNFQLQ